MPIVIRELVIRARLEEGECNTGKNGSAQQNGRVSASGSGNTDHIVALCVEKVMETIERKNER